MNRRQTTDTVNVILLEQISLVGTAQPGHELHTEPVRNQALTVSELPGWFDLNNFN